MADLLTALGIVENYEIKMGKKGNYVHIKVDGKSFNLFDSLHKKIAEENVGKAVQVNYEMSGTYTNAKAIYPQNPTAPKPEIIQTPTPGNNPAPPITKTNHPPTHNGEPIKTETMSKADWQAKDRVIVRVAVAKSLIEAKRNPDEVTLIEAEEWVNWIYETQLSKEAKQLGFVDTNEEYLKVKTYIEKNNVDPDKLASIAGCKNKDEMRTLLLNGQLKADQVITGYERLKK